jgi:hypothetical protein
MIINPRILEDSGFVSGQIADVRTIYQIYTACPNDEAAVCEFHLNTGQNLTPETFSNEP